MHVPPHSRYSVKLIRAKGAAPEELLMTFDYDAAVRVFDQWCKEPLHHQLLIVRSDGQIMAAG